MAGSVMFGKMLERAPGAPGGAPRVPPYLLPPIHSPGRRVGAPRSAYPIPPILSRGGKGGLFMPAQPPRADGVTPLPTLRPGAPIDRFMSGGGKGALGRKFASRKSASPVVIQPGRVSPKSPTSGRGRYDGERSHGGR